jgi:4-azaleucine resistance transporter AzlC
LKRLINEEIKKGIISALPIIVGYLPIGMAFGILSKTTGISLLESFMFSSLVFAGASQFMALNLMLVGTGIGGIILTTLLVNFRHFLMSASLTEKIKDIDSQSKGWLGLIAFGITDEVFSVASFREGKITREYLISLEALSLFGWVGGTVLGYIIGSILPDTIQASMGVGIYAMFIALLLPEAKKSRKVALLAILSGITNTILTFMEFLPQGWNIIVSILLISGLGLLFEGKEDISFE